MKHYVIGNDKGFYITRGAEDGYNPAPGLEDKFFVTKQEADLFLSSYTRNR